MGKYSKDVQAKNIDEQALTLFITEAAVPVPLENIQLRLSAYPKKVVKARLDAMVRKRMINEGSAGYTSNDVMQAAQ